MMTNAEQGPVLIMAGGTGGHVFPALAVADELRARGVQVSWLGTQRGLEARVVPAAALEPVVSGRGNAVDGSALDASRRESGAPRSTGAV